MDEENKQSRRSDELDVGTPTEASGQTDKAEEYLNNWKRERADFLNYKKDELKRLSEFAKFANEGVVLEVIELMDDLETASKEIGDPGLNQIVKKFEEFLKNHEVERIDTRGEFDPLLHEAVTTEAQNGTTEIPRSRLGGTGIPAAESGLGTQKIEEAKETLEEFRAGYTMHGKVIRPARVKIIK